MIKDFDPQLQTVRCIHCNLYVTKGFENDKWWDKDGFAWCSRSFKEPKESDKDSWHTAGVYDGVRVSIGGVRQGEG